MTTRIIKTTDQRADLCALLSNIEKLPITVTWVQGKDRTGQQNALAFAWYKEIADQLGDRDAHDVRAHCKLNIGVKMLVTEDLEFREQWTKFFRDRFTYEEKLALMLEPHDYPVTRIMRVSQMTRYLEGIIETYTPMGVQLTMPEDKL